jgi:hypothetical protein
LIALLRHHEAGNWDYNGGYSDYCRYTQFIDTWARQEIARIVANQRQRLDSEFVEHFKLALVLYPRIQGLSLTEKLAKLCTHEDKVEAELSKTGIIEWDEYRAKICGQWTDRQSKWLNWFSTNRHALEGDIALSYLRGIGTIEPPVEATRIVALLHRQLIAEFPNIELFRECNTQDEYLDTLKSLSELVTTLKAHAQYQGMDGYLGAKAYTNQIDKLLELSSWPSTKAFLSLGSQGSLMDSMANLNQLDIDKLRMVNTILTHWHLLFKNNINRIRNENNRHGLERRKESQEIMNQTLNAISEQLCGLAELK